MKEEKMAQALKLVEEITNITRPGKNAELRYVRITADNNMEFSEWDWQRFNFHVGDERILVIEESGHILYALNVTYNSIMQSIADLTDLLAGKGW